MIRIGDVLIINRLDNARIEEIHQYYSKYRYDDIVGIFIDLNNKVEINKNIYGIKGNKLYTYELIRIEYDEIKESIDLYYEAEDSIENNKLVEKEALYNMLYADEAESGLSDEQIQQLFSEL